MDSFIHLWNYCGVSCVVFLSRHKTRVHFYYFSPLYLIDYPRTVDFAITVILINVNFNQGYVAVVKAEKRT